MICKTATTIRGLKASLKKINSISRSKRKRIFVKENISFILSIHTPNGHNALYFSRCFFIIIFIFKRFSFFTPKEFYNAICKIECCYSTISIVYDNLAFGFFKLFTKKCTFVARRTVLSTKWKILVKYFTNMHTLT